MRKLIEKLQGEIEAFVEQRDDLLLITECSDDDAAMVLKIVEGVEQENGTDVFLFFADEFSEAGSYVSSLVAGLREQHRIAGEWLKEQEREPLPPLPVQLEDPELSPGERLRQAMAFSRSLLPGEPGPRMVWALVPLAIGDHRRYLDLVSELIPVDGLKPWMRGLRVVVRDEPGTAAARASFEGAPRLRRTVVDMGPGAIQRALAEDVEDEELSDEERMQALLQNALLDSAHGRHDDAVAQFKILLGYYQQAEDPLGQAVVLNSMGDLHLRREEMVEAEHFYECAVPQAVEAESAVLLHTCVWGLADIAFQTRKFDRGQQLYKGAEQLAGKLLYPEGRAQALEKKGLCEEARGRLKEAVASWKEAVDFSRNLELNTPLAANLEHLVRGYSRLGSRSELYEARRELQALGAAEPAPN